MKTKEYLYGESNLKETRQKGTEIEMIRNLSIWKQMELLHLNK